MLKDYYMKSIKRRSYKEMKLYFKNISALYDLFNENELMKNENDIFEYIESMPMNEIMEMLASIIKRCDFLEIDDCYSNSVLFKFMIIEYIQEQRFIKD